MDIPINSWGHDWQTINHVQSLEKKIAGDYCCAVSSIQIAVQACLELLGTNTGPVPVIMPVTAPPDTMSGVLRSGAHPFLLDIDEDTLQLNYEDLKTVLAEFEVDERVPIVLFNRPAGAQIDEALLELALDVPSIVDSRLVPSPDMTEKDITCTFNIFDFAPLCGTGALVITGFEDLIKRLKLIRSGVMGFAGILPEIEAKEALGKINSEILYHQLYAKNVKKLFEKGQEEGLDFFDPGYWPGPLYLRVNNARLTVAHLQSFGIQAMLGVFPLHNLDEISMRYAESPQYPVAESLENQIVCIPTMGGVAGKTAQIIERIVEVNA